MQVERFWVLAAKKLAAQATAEELAELDRLATAYTNMQDEVQLLSTLYNNTPGWTAAKKDAASLLLRVRAVNRYNQYFFNNETNH